MRSFAAFAALVAVLFGLLLSREGPGECPHDPESCFFSDTYEAARSRFREAVHAANGELHTLPLGDHAPGLTIDCAVFGGALEETAPLLVHISGTHGVEAHAGSAVQLALLKAWSEAPDSLRGVRLILVHALNPFGFKYGRRFNEDNIDLNRNMLPDDAFPGRLAELVRTGGPGAELYRQFSPLWDLDHGWRPFLDEVLLWLRVPYHLAKYGMTHLKRAVVSGQYFCPTCIFYGGTKLSASHEQLLRFLNAHAARSSAALVIDVHTGLGPTGVDTLMPHMGAAAASHIDASVRFFGKPSWGAQGTDFLIEGSSEAGDAIDPSAGSGYDLAEGGTHNLLRAMPGWAKAMHVTQEFGTMKGVLVLRAMMVERAEWVHRGGSALGARNSRAAFYVKTASWQRRVVRRGTELVAQALTALADASAREHIPGNTMSD